MPSLHELLYTVRGPEFLKWFVAWFVVLRLAVGLIRYLGFDNLFTTLVGIIVFEWLGLARMAIGMAHGMHKWDFLIAIMVFGAVAFTARADQFQASGSSRRWGGSCSSGSSCSSGGGCGGGSGCGGCGGS
jgi:hypothetical protein